MSSKKFICVLIAVAACILLGSAVPVDNNSDRKCTEDHEVYKFCAARQPTCESHYIVHPIVGMALDCPHGCHCDYGYVRNTTIDNYQNGVCIKPEECSDQFKLNT